MGWKEIYFCSYLMLLFGKTTWCFCFSNFGIFNPTHPKIVSFSLGSITNQTTKICFLFEFRLTTVSDLWTLSTWERSFSSNLDEHTILLSERQVVGACVGRIYNNVTCSQIIVKRILVMIYNSRLCSKIFTFWKFGTFLGSHCESISVVSFENFYKIWTTIDILTVSVIPRRRLYFNFFLNGIYGSDVGYTNFVHVRTIFTSNQDEHTNTSFEYKLVCGLSTKSYF